MKAKTSIKKGSRVTWPPFRLTIKSLIISALILTGIQTSLQAQDSIQYTKPTWWLGAAAGANFNFYQGTTQKLDADLTVPAAFHKGKGIGLFAFPVLEFHRPDTKLGFMLNAGYESRRGTFDQEISPCNCPEDLSTKLAYITIEPSIRFNPFSSNLYLFAGPRLAFNIDKRFTYKKGPDPDAVPQVFTPDVHGVFSDMRKSLISVQIGAGYDFTLTAENKPTQIILAPFIAFHPYFGQDPRKIESWNLTTLRAGLALKFGRGQKVSSKEKEEVIVPVPISKIVFVEPDVRFSAYAPANIAVERRVRETFPVRNYVFFNLGSTEIPDRYVLLRKGQVKEFREDQLEVFTPKELTGRSKRQLTVYYNVINILGDRMIKNPTTIVRLSGASMTGKKDGRAMAESVKKYLVDIFGIEAARINTEGRIKPRIPSEQLGGKLELDLLREGDHRVSIWSESPALMMEFQSGPDAPLKPVEIVDLQVAPIDSYVSFNVLGADTAFTSWSLEIADEQGKVQNFGPYTQETMSIPGKSILGTRPVGDYKVTMVGQLKSGKTLKKETSVHLVLWIPTVPEEMMRFSIIFEFNDSRSIEIYKKYLTDIVTPKIPIGGTVIIHGHTDIIGEEAHNLKLSLARATEVRNIFDNALEKAGRTDVKFEVFGFGEDQNLEPFNNKYPEERFYNRTVIIDIIPKK